MAAKVQQKFHNQKLIFEFAVRTGESIFLFVLTKITKKL